MPRRYRRGRRGGAYSGLRNVAGERRAAAVGGAQGDGGEPARADRAGVAARVRAERLPPHALGSYSLDARIALAERATQSLEVQYYLIANDKTGRLLLNTVKRLPPPACVSGACACLSAIARGLRRCCEKSQRKLSRLVSLAPSQQGL